MSKYAPLTEFLLKKDGREVRLTFSQIEEILGQKLPAKSKVHRPWWSNNPSNNVMTKAWLAAGYRTAQVDVEGEKLSFIAAKPPSGMGERKQTSFIADTNVKRRHPLFGSLRGTSILTPGTDLTLPADPEWGHVYDASYDHGAVADDTRKERR